MCAHVRAQPAAVHGDSNRLQSLAAPYWAWRVPCTDRRSLLGDMQPCCLQHARLAQDQDVPKDHLMTLHMLQEDLTLVETAGSGRVDVTVGSALDIFGGRLAFDDVLKWHHRN